MQNIFTGDDPMYPITAFDRSLNKQSVTVGGTEVTLSGFVGYSKKLCGKDYAYVWWLHYLYDNKEFVITLTDDGVWTRSVIPDEFTLLKKEQRYLCWCHCVEGLTAASEAVAVANIPAVLAGYLNTPNIPPKAWYKEHTLLKMIGGGSYTNNEPVTQIFSKSKMVEQYRHDRYRTLNTTKYIFLSLTIVMFGCLLVSVWNRDLIPMIIFSVLSALCLIVFFKDLKNGRKLRTGNVPVEIQKLRCTATRILEGDDCDVYLGTFIDHLGNEQDYGLGQYFSNSPCLDGEDCILVFLGQRRDLYMVGTACNTRIVE